MTPMPTPMAPPTPPPNRASTPESPTPQRGLALASSPSPLALSPRPLSPPPAPRDAPRTTSTPTDLARQIAAVTEHLAGLRAEEQRLSQVQHQQEEQDVLPRACTPPRGAFRRILLIEEECIRCVSRLMFVDVRPSLIVMIDCALNLLRLSRARRRCASCSYQFLRLRRCMARIALRSNALSIC